MCQPLQGSGSILMDLDTTWTVIGSAETVAARFHIPAIGPIYNLDGQVSGRAVCPLSGTPSALFDVRSLNASIAFDQFGNRVDSAHVWTGTNHDGTTHVAPLGGILCGDPFEPYSVCAAYGYIGQIDKPWINYDETLGVSSVEKTSTKNHLLRDQRSACGPREHDGPGGDALHGHNSGGRLRRASKGHHGRPLRRHDPAPGLRDHAERGARGPKCQAQGPGHPRRGAGPDDPGTEVAWTACST